MSWCVAASIWLLSVGTQWQRNLYRNIFEISTKLQVHIWTRLWPFQHIKYEDVKAFQAYSLFLHGCCNAMEELQYMQELDMPVNIRIIMSKMPFKMREQWRTIAHDKMETTNQRARFTDLVMFIERRVRILSVPLFSEI